MSCGVTELRKLGQGRAGLSPDTAVTEVVEDGSRGIERVRHRHMDDYA